MSFAILIMTLVSMWGFFTLKAKHEPAIPFYLNMETK
jgi:hypothetical protein